MNKSIFGVAPGICAKRSYLISGHICLFIPTIRYRWEALAYPDMMMKPKFHRHCVALRMREAGRPEFWEKR
ncbi:hypothetical protein B2D07_00945 [Desulfococcus multivorans]|nr:uncharacterized protein Dmul_01870 [Desulfococcus multivorans]AQU99484.1 hypothetical protein B2D07_00945 [Desulfococcus multivorans]